MLWDACFQQQWPLFQWRVHAISSAINNTFALQCVASCLHNVLFVMMMMMMMMMMDTINAKKYYYHNAFEGHVVMGAEPRSTIWNDRWTTWLRRSKLQMGPDKFSGPGVWRHQGSWNVRTVGLEYLCYWFYTLTDDEKLMQKNYKYLTVKKKIHTKVI